MIVTLQRRGIVYFSCMYQDVWPPGERAVADSSNQRINSLLFSVTDSAEWLIIKTHTVAVISCVARWVLLWVMEMNAGTHNTVNSFKPIYVTAGPLFFWQTDYNDQWQHLQYILLLNALALKPLKIMYVD